MDYFSDTARQYWLIGIAGLLAGGWFFFDYSNHHPMKYADASLGEQVAISTGEELLGELGYMITDAEYRATFKTKKQLLDQIQSKVSLGEYMADREKNRGFNPFYWNLDLMFPRTGTSLSDQDFTQWGVDQSASLAIRLNEKGEWMELVNRDNHRPLRLLNAEAMADVGNLPEELLVEARDDSVAAAVFSFDFENNLDDITDLYEDGMVLLGVSQARTIAGYYLEMTGWPIENLEFTEARIVPMDDIEAAEVRYRLTDQTVEQELLLTAMLSPAGSVFSLSADYQMITDEDQTISFIINSSRGVLMLFFAVWLIILLYIRVQLRVVDIKSGILFAVLAGMALPAFIFFEWLYEQLLIPGTPGLTDIVMILVRTGFTAAIVSLVFFIITVIGESLTRQHQIDKIRTMDLIRIGHFLNIPVGGTFINGVSFGLIIAGIWSLSFWVIPGLHLSVDPEFISNTTLLAPLVQIMSSFFLCFIIIQSVFLVVSGQLNSWKRNNLVIVVACVLIFMILSPVSELVMPITQQMLLNGLVGLILGVIFIYSDFLTTFLSYFIFILLITTADGWIMDYSPDADIFYLAAGIGILFLGFGYIAVTRGKPVNELPKYIPEYIEDLAQEERIKQELQIARKVQQSFLPVKKPDFRGLDLAAVCIPAYETGGDYYDFIDVTDQKVAITVGDVSGKGFQAAFYMTFIKGVLHALCLDTNSTVDILTKANQLIRKNARRGTFISIIYGIIDLDTFTFSFSRAGHNPLLHYREKENLLKNMKPNGIALGMTDGVLFEENILETTIHLDEGDIIILYTDGIVEAVNHRNEFYGEKRLHRMIYFHHRKNSQEIIDHVLKDIEKFSDGANQHDDMTLVVIKQK